VKYIYTVKVNSNFKTSLAVLGQFRGKGRAARGRRGMGPRSREHFESGIAQVVDRNPLDILTNLFPSPKMGNPVEDRSHSYQSDVREENEVVPAEENNGGAIDVDRILALARTLGYDFSQPSGVNNEEGMFLGMSFEKLRITRFCDIQICMYLLAEQSENPSEEKLLAFTDEKAEEPSKPIVPPLETVDMTFNDNLKERRSKLVGQLWTGVQCASCGLRFPPDQTVRYNNSIEIRFS